MIRRVLPMVAMLLMTATVAIAGTCTCAPTKTCNISGGDRDWTGTGCRCQGGTCKGTDDLVVQAGAHLSLNGSATVDSIVVQAGGFMDCAHDTTARTITVKSAPSGPQSNNWNAWVWLDAGSTTNCAGATGVEGENIRFAYAGTAPANGANFFVGRGLITETSPIDAVFNFRGLRRTSTTVTTVSQGATTTDFVYCLDLLGGAAGAVDGDTAVFTSGNLTDYWCKVVAPTSECANACQGGACDIQIDCNAPGRDFLSVTKGVAGLGGPFRHPTPDDGDADGVADNAYLFPAIGDALDVFLPAIIEGGMVATVNGARIILAGVRANMRYMTFRNLTADSYVNACGSTELCPRSSAIHSEVVTPVAPEGDIGFTNVHDWASQSTFEMSATDRTDDARPNYPAKWSHIYEHDPYDVTGCSCGDQSLGGGISVTVDAGDTMREENVTISGLHAARLYGGAISIDGPQAYGTPAREWNNIRINRVLVHDIPNSTSWFDREVPAVVGFLHGLDVQFNGVHCWDIGRTGANWGCIDASPSAAGTTPLAPNSGRFSNLYAVNVDTNAKAADQAQVVDFTYAVMSPYNVDTSVNVLTNSYIANTVGTAVRGGSTYYSLFHNDSLADGGTCDTDTQKAVALFPVDFVGNYVENSSAVSCYNTAIFFQPIGEVDSDLYATRARNITGNYLTGMSSTMSYALAGVELRTVDGVIGQDINFSYNVCDAHDVLTSSEQYGCVYWWNTPMNPTTSRLKAYDNVAMNFPSTPAMFYELGVSGSTVDFGYNRYHLIGTPPVDGTENDTIYSTGGLRIGDIVDNDPDFHPVPPKDLASLLRASPISIASSGTNRILPCDSTNFLEYFHPAALATMNPLFFSSVQCNRHDYLPLYPATVSP